MGKTNFEMVNYHNSHIPRLSSNKVSIPWYVFFCSCSDFGVWFSVSGFWLMVFFFWLFVLIFKWVWCLSLSWTFVWSCYLSSFSLYVGSKWDLGLGVGPGLGLGVLVLVLWKCSYPLSIEYRCEISHIPLVFSKFQAIICFIQQPTGFMCCECDLNLFSQYTLVWYHTVWYHIIVYYKIYHWYQYWEL